MAKVAVPLRLRILHALPAALEKPRYERSDLSPGIVHFGIGNFHRAHQAAWLHDLMNAGLARDWSIVGAGVTAADAAMKARLERQDLLTTLVEQDEGFERMRLIGSMTAYVAPDDRQALLGWLSDPRIRIASLTVTEGGYFLDAATGRFDARHPAIARDGGDLSAATTVFGLIAAGLQARRKAGLRPFTVMSCDNLPHNGRVTRAAVTGVARLADPELAEWIEAEGAFPNAMVDRITPATDEARRHWLADERGILDEAPVFCEPFRQWVLEDSFADGRPPLDEAGVTFTADVTPYETMKIRILNGGHATLAYPAALLGITLVHDAMRHPLVAAFLARVTREEIAPLVRAPEGASIPAYQALVAQRFANPKVEDTVRRLCFDGSNRQPKFIVPSIADALAAGAPVAGLALVSALWCRYCAGRTESGDVVAPNDPSWERLAAAAARAATDPGAWLAQEDVYGETGRHPVFAEAFARAHSALQEEGVAASLARYAGQEA